MGLILRCFVPGHGISFAPPEDKGKRPLGIESWRSECGGMRSNKTR